MSGTGADSEDKTADKTAAESPTEEKQSDNGNGSAVHIDKYIGDASDNAEASTDTPQQEASLNKAQTEESSTEQAAPEETAESKSESAQTDNQNEAATTDSDKQKVSAEQASSLTLTQHHVSHLLSDVLQDETAPEAPVVKGLRFPMIFDLLLGAGLLVAVGGFTVGLLHMYIVHSASQFISEQRYEKAITVLKGAPLPQVFSRTGTDTEELLSKARYLDAMDKIESNNNVEFALKELAEIHPGSKYFALAQEAINENTEPAEVMLQGGAETTEAPGPEREQTLLERTLKEEKENEKR